jgi:hypothetical protein
MTAFDTGGWSASPVRSTLGRLTAGLPVTRCLLAVLAAAVPLLALAALLNAEYRCLPFAIHACVGAGPTLSGTIAADSLSRTAAWISVVATAAGIISGVEIGVGALRGGRAVGALRPPPGYGRSRWVGAFILLGVVLVWAGGVLLPFVGCGGIGPMIEVGRGLSLNYAICPYSSVLKHAAPGALGLVLLVVLHGSRGNASRPPSAA